MIAIAPVPVGVTAAAGFDVRFAIAKQATKNFRTDHCGPNAVMTDRVMLLIYRRFRPAATMTVLRGRERLGNVALRRG